MTSVESGGDAAAVQGALPLVIDDRKIGRRAISPKRPPVEKAGFADMFPYYAGFSFDWACAELNALANGSSGQLVLDPWNGSGTTTLAAQYGGQASIGVDLNPVANMVAQVRCRVGHSARVVSRPRKSYRTRSIANDPLLNWFSLDTASRIRDWTVMLARTPAEQAAPATVAIFKVVRGLTKSFEGSNPTWVKRSKSDDDRVFCTADSLDELIAAENKILVDRLRKFKSNLPSASLLTASASRLPLRDASVDLVLTSPPYLTRIDYGVAYSRELAVLGIDVFKQRQLREGLMGTTLIRPNVDKSLRFGSVASELIERISRHQSKASGGYYLKQAIQYLVDLTSSLDELTRVAKVGATACFVVQDSYYKDIHVPLADICADEGIQRGWKVESADPFPVVRSLMSLNKSAREYAKGDVSESVLILKRI